MSGLLYCITTFNRPDALPQAVMAAKQSDVKPEWIVVVDNSPEQYAGRLVGQLQRVVVLARGWNAGLPSSINLCFDLFDGVHVFGNDDLMVHPHTLGEMYRAMINHQSVSHFFGTKDAFSFFGMQKWAWLDIGGWDESFYPVWFDDTDVARRLHLAGHDPMVLQNATFDHIGSGSMKRLVEEKGQAAHTVEFLANQNRYIRKWGGEPGFEKFTVPYNGAREA